LVGVGLGRADAAVVDGMLDARRVRHGRLGDTDREDDRRRPVLAVGRLQDEFVRAVRSRFTSRAGPATAEADGDPGSGSERLEIGLHLRT
jgi:hypothetical protein